jgi:hypothetical protein
LGREKVGEQIRKKGRSLVVNTWEGEDGEGKKGLEKVRKS